MLELTTVGLDLAKNVFQVHGADACGGAVLRKKLRRAQPCMGGLGHQMLPDPVIAA